MRDEPALSDITVVDLSEGVAGAWCTRLLAGLGARVLKVEQPGGELLRRLPPFQGDAPHPEQAGLFLYLNAAKQGLTLDLTSSDGQALARRLLAHADVLVESFPPGTLARHGLDYATLADQNPGLIVASLTPFGQDGPYRDYQGDDLIAQAVGGLMHAIGLPEREPLKIGGSPALMNTGGAAFSAIMAAVWQRDSTGAGQQIDVSAQAATAMSQVHGSVFAAFSGEATRRVASELVPAADGWATPGLDAGVTADIWPRICALLGRPELADDPRFANTATRREHRLALAEAVSAWARTRPKEEIYHQLQALRTIAGYVATAADLHASPQFQARGYFQSIDHPVVGVVSMPGAPFRLGDEPWVMGRAPLLGEHNAAVFGDELGIDAAELARLRAAGVI